MAEVLLMRGLASDKAEKSFDVLEINPDHIRNKLFAYSWIEKVLRLRSPYQCWKRQIN